MQDSNIEEKHEAKLIYGERLELSDVKKVPSFDNQEVEVLLSREKLRITGEKLEIDSLDLDKGLLTLTGKVKSLTYYSGNIKKSFMSKVFK